MSTLKMDVHENAKAAAQAAARFIAAQAHDAVAARGRFLLALSGGRDAPALLHHLAGEDLPWPRLHVLQVDERMAPDGDVARNWTLLARMLDGTPLPAANRHPLPVAVEDDLEAVVDMAEARMTLLAGSPPTLDLVHLGLGEDGHTASLMPDDALLRVNRRDLAVTSTAYGGYRRMTLTLPALARARSRLWLVTGASKREVLARFLAGDEHIPAARVPVADSLLIADRAAAG